MTLPEFWSTQFSFPGMVKICNHFPKSTESIFQIFICFCDCSHLKKKWLGFSFSVYYFMLSRNSDTLEAFNCLWLARSFSYSEWRWISMKAPSGNCKWEMMRIFQNFDLPGVFFLDMAQLCEYCGLSRQLEVWQMYVMVEYRSWPFVVLCSAGFRSDATTSPPGGERDEADSGVYDVLRGGLLHQAKRDGNSGESH